MVVAGGGDGQVAGLGVNALTPERAYLNLGTAVVSSTVSKNYIVDRSFRTMTTCSEEGYYCETSLRAGTFLIDWFIKQVLKMDVTRNQDIYQQLEKEAGEVKPGSEGLMILPYWNAVMNPYWDRMPADVYSVLLQVITEVICTGQFLKELQWNRHWQLRLWKRQLGKKLMNLQ